ncbi:MAG TPA: hypothetical protein DGR79_06155 [Clostridiales bacterium]|nr:hypothetical protein [Clostridiales bacterium]
MSRRQSCHALPDHSRGNVPVSEGSRAEHRNRILKAFDEVLSVLSEALLGHYGDRLVSAAVFGSVARRTPNPESDIDLLVVAHGLPVGRSRRVEEFQAVDEAVEPHLRALEERGISTRLSPVFRTPAEVQEGGPLFLDMTEHVLLLHDRGGFLQRYLDRLRAELEKTGARRLRYKGAWYWDLGPGKGDGSR